MLSACSLSLSDASDHLLSSLTTLVRAWEWVFCPPLKLSIACSTLLDMQTFSSRLPVMIISGGVPDDPEGILVIVD